MAWEQLRSSYDAVAHKYEAQFLDELQDKPRDRQLLAAFAGSVGDPILEVGCGPGQVGAFVRQRGRSVLGLDLSAEMARLAMGRLDGVIAGDMRWLPVGGELLGGVVAFYSLIHVQRGVLCTVLEEFHRVLRPGGRVLFTVHEGATASSRSLFHLSPPSSSSMS